MNRFFILFLFGPKKLAPKNFKTAMETLLQASIHDSLQFHLHSNAIFLSERLYAEFRTLSNLHLLANCHVQNGQYKQAYNLLQSTAKDWQYSASENALLIQYLFAVCCCKLQKFVDAEKALEFLHSHQNDAHVLYLLGFVCRYTNKREKAIDYFKQALALNPMLWCAYEHLCQMGMLIYSVYVYIQADKLERTMFTTCLMLHLFSLILASRCFQPIKLNILPIKAPYLVITAV